jgi:hypothetical protein
MAGIGLQWTSLQIREIYAFVALYVVSFFFSSPTDQTPQPIFKHIGSNDTVSFEEVLFGI